MDFLAFAVENARTEFGDDLERAALKWLARIERDWRERQERDRQVQRWLTEQDKAIWGGGK